MNPMQPEATHVAVRDGRILGVGSVEGLQAWGAARLDTRFADKVLMPGLVEGHAHLLDGGMWNFVYTGFHDRRGPDGSLWPGVQSFDALVERLREAVAQLPDPDQPLLAWGFDPIHFGIARMTVEHLDEVSATRPVVVLHASVHLLNVNSAMLRLAGIDSDTRIEGIARDASGQPTGELQEMAAMFPVFAVIGNVFFDAAQTEEAIRNFGKLAQLAGVTTATDLANGLSETAVNNLLKVTSEPQFPVRVVPAFSPMRDPSGQGPQRLCQLMGKSHDKLHFGLVKLIVDGSIQGFTARLRWPHYHGGQPNGIWVIPPQKTQELIEQYHRAGFTLHIHTNGDEATDMVLDAVEAVLRKHPRWDHRHTLQHCQLADAAQFRRMAVLGMAVNLFSNHL
jgi:predicted amidohydrolase YtcJ